MGRTNAHFILFLTFISLAGVRSENVTCRWDGSIEAEGECFLYNITELSYSDAKIACKSKGGVLATVRNRTQLEAAVTDPSHDTYWIGASDSVKEGKWVWEDDGAVATELSDLWYPGEPSNRIDTQDCARIAYTVAFDEECDNQHGFLCMEKEMITTPDTPASTSTATVPVTTMMKCGANFINSNVLSLLFLNVCAFNDLVI